LNGWSFAVDDSPEVMALNRVAQAIEGFNVILATLATTDELDKASTRNQHTTRWWNGLLVVLIILVGLGVLRVETLVRDNAVQTQLIESQQHFIDAVEKLICTSAPAVCVNGHLNPDATIPGG
jgi:uncharacterized membrane protein YidH (DUF202 family)